MPAHKKKRPKPKLLLPLNLKKAPSEESKLGTGLRNGTIITVNKSKIVSRSAIPSIPHYYYDTQITCRDCGTEETWTAKRQQWWYEVQGGEIESIAIRCRACRRKERLRRDTARKAHLEGLAKKQKKTPTVPRSTAL